MIIFALIRTYFHKVSQGKGVRDIHVKELPDLPIPKDEKQMLRKILYKLDAIKEQQRNIQSRMEVIESHLGVYSV
jgi:hypothetical protein